MNSRLAYLPPSLQHQRSATVMVTFLTLPYDIRPQILYHLHHEETRYGPKETDGCTGYESNVVTWDEYFDFRTGSNVLRNQLSSQLLRCCRQIHDESKRILYGEQTIRINQVETLATAWSQGCYFLQTYRSRPVLLPQGPRNLPCNSPRIKHLRINFVQIGSGFSTYVASRSHFKPSLRSSPVPVELEGHDDEVAIRKCVRQAISYDMISRLSVHMRRDHTPSSWGGSCLEDRTTIIPGVCTRLRAVDGTHRRLGTPKVPANTRYPTLWLENKAWPDAHTIRNVDKDVLKKLKLDAIAFDQVCRNLVVCRPDSLPSYCCYDGIRDLEWSMRF